MRRNSWAGLLVVGLALASVFAQQAAPANPASAAKIVQVRTGHSCGLCGGGYTESDTAIGPDWIVRTDQSPAEKRKYPDSKLEYAISTPDWEELQRYIDARVLSAFVGAIGCPGCADHPVEWVEVKFSDGTKKSVSYDEGNGPPTIIALLEKITAIVARGQPIFKINMKPIKVVRAVYPATIKSAGIRQSVVVDVIIGKAGSVEKAKAVRGSQEFWGAATEAVKQWKWKPYLVNGRPALARTSVTVIFDPHR